MSDFDSDSDWMDCGLTWDTGGDNGGGSDPTSGFEQDDASDGESIYDPFEYEKIKEDLPEHDFDENDEDDEDDLPLRERGFFGLIFDELSNVLKGM